MTRSIMYTEQEQLSCYARQAEHAADLTRTLKPLRAWLETFDPDEIIINNMVSVRRCLAASFLKTHGISDDVIYGVEQGRVHDFWYFTAGRRFALVIHMGITEQTTEMAMKPIRARDALGWIDRVSAMSTKEVNMRYRDLTR